LGAIHHLRCPGPRLRFQSPVEFGGETLARPVETHRHRRRPDAEHDRDLVVVEVVPDRQGEDFSIVGAKPRFWAISIAPVISPIEMP